MEPYALLQYEGKKLTEIINEQHENPKYLPGIKFPENVIAYPSVVDAARGATLLVFVLPHQVSSRLVRNCWLLYSVSDKLRSLLLIVPFQFITGICKELRGKVDPSATAISMIKGVDVKDGNINIFADVIQETLGIECSALSGANIANEGKSFSSALPVLHSLTRFSPTPISRARQIL